MLPSDRLELAFGEDDRGAYAEAKQTLAVVAVVVAAPSKRKLQPIARSADWRVHLAEGCPVHCSYCYPAGSLKAFEASCYTDPLAIEQARDIPSA